MGKTGIKISFRKDAKREGLTVFAARFDVRGAG